MLCTSQGCVTNSPPTQISTATFGAIGAIVPHGTFEVLIYPPLIMNYDPSVWKDESHYSDISSQSAHAVLNYLQSLNLSSCQIGVQGPTGDFPATPAGIQLKSLQYDVITFADAPTGSTTTYYIENKSLARFNYDIGSPVFVVQAVSSEWDECKTPAEEVLATLHVP